MSNKPYYNILDIKPTHFNESGWASFDAITIEQLKSAMELGCTLSDRTPILKIVFIMGNHPEIMCFGEMDKNGVIKILGLRGFANDEMCIRLISDITENVKKRNITKSYIYIEW